jgi:hypothetical protein
MRGFFLRPILAIDQAMVGPQGDEARTLGDEFDQLVGPGEAVVLEGDDSALGTDLQAFDADDLHRFFNATTCSRFSASTGSGPKRSIISAAKASISWSLPSLRQAAIEAEADIQILHINLGDQHRHANIDLRLPLGGRGLFRAARLAHRFLEQMLVELDADFAHVAGLLVAQQIAGAADVEIVARQAESPAPS